MDYYRILNVEFSASKQDIQKAYRNLAKKYHPDKNMDQSEDASIRFKVLKDAFDILSNDEERKKYDSSYKYEKYNTSSSAYDVTVDDMGIDIHSMNIHVLSRIDDVFQNDISSTHLL